MLNIYDLCAQLKINKESLNPRHSCTQLISSFLILLIQKCDSIQSFFINKTNFYVNLIKLRNCETVDQFLKYVRMFIWDVFVNQFVLNLDTDECQTLDDLEILYEEFLKSATKNQLKKIEENLDSFYMFVWSRYTAPVMKDFGQIYLMESHSIEYMTFLFTGFGYYLGWRYNKISSNHS